MDRGHDPSTGDCMDIKPVFLLHNSNVLVNFMPSGYRDWLQARNLRVPEAGMDQRNLNLPCPDSLGEDWKPFQLNFFLPPRLQLRLVVGWPKISLGFSIMENPE